VLLSLIAPLDHHANDLGGIVVRRRAAGIDP
jgi:hypothetical protein